MPLLIEYIQSITEFVYTFLSADAKNATSYIYLVKKWQKCVHGSFRNVWGFFSSPKSKSHDEILKLGAATGPSLMTSVDLKLTRKLTCGCYQLGTKKGLFKEENLTLNVGDYSLCVQDKTGRKKAEFVVGGFLLIIRGPSLSMDWLMWDVLLYVCCFYWLMNKTALNNGLAD